MSTITGYPRYPDEEIVRCINELREQIPEWFADNPKRKICKVDLFYGRSIDVRRDNWEERLNTEQGLLIREANTEDPEIQAFHGIHPKKP